MTGIICLIAKQFISLLIVKKCVSILALAICMLAGVSCSREGDYDPVRGYSHVLIYCGLGYNNLSSYLDDNMTDMKSGLIPDLNRDLAVVAFCHNTASDYDYKTPVPPVLLRIYRDRGAVRTDTLKVYPEDMVSASAASIRRMMLDVKEMFPSESYGMLFSSHASGWIPVGYSGSGEIRGMMLMEHGQNPELPLTKTLGAQYQGSSSNSVEMDVRDFAQAIPMHLDYMIFDACLLGSVEFAWELKDVCDRIVFSPTEVLASGFVYKTLVKNLMSGRKADLEAVCREYFERYDSQEGLNRSATVSLVDCSKLEGVAEIFRLIATSCGNRIPQIDRDSVQKYFYDDKRFFFYYDLRDFAAAMNPDPDLLAELDLALDECVVYHAETPSFFNLELERCCGLSVYFPSQDWQILNGYYRDLGWNVATGLVK